MKETNHSEHNNFDCESTIEAIAHAIYQFQSQLSAGGVFSTVNIPDRKDFNEMNTY